MLKIGEFSKLSRVSVRMLRYYDEIGLLSPAEINSVTGYRYYQEEQLATAGRILCLRDMGFGIAEIRDILNAYYDREIVEGYLLQKGEELRKLVEETEYRIRLLETAREWLRKDNYYMNYNVNVKTIPERLVASVRMTVPRYDMEGMLWGILMEETDSMPLIPDDPCLCGAIFHDREYKEENVDIEVQKTVKGSYSDTEHVRFKREEAVLVASAIHRGSYRSIGEAMGAVAQWIRDNGYELNGEIFNLYHVSPYETKDESEFVTEVCYPVRRNG